MQRNISLKLLFSFVLGEHAFGLEPLIVYVWDAQSYDIELHFKHENKEYPLDSENFRGL